MQRHPDAHLQHRSRNHHRQHQGPHPGHSQPRLPGASQRYKHHPLQAADLPLRHHLHGRRDLRAPPCRRAHGRGADPRQQRRRARSNQHLRHRDCACDRIHSSQPVLLSGRRRVQLRSACRSRHGRRRQHLCRRFHQEGGLRNAGQRRIHHRQDTGWRLRLRRAVRSRRRRRRQCLRQRFHQQSGL